MENNGPTETEHGEGGVISRLRKAWLDLGNFGNHEGPCDNPETCESCGTSLNACSAHLGTMQRRMAAVSDAIAALVRKYGEDG